jgi:hypothetical protein
MEYIIDADDFHETNNRLDLLFRIKEHIPNFKINLFTVPGLCSDRFLEEMKKLDWIDMIPHGWTHPNPIECAKWTYAQSCSYLDRIEPLKLTHGFKAPGWQITDGMYGALLEKGYWVADQPYNNKRRPSELRAYVIDADNKKHYHIQNVCGNGLEERFNEIMSLSGEFQFIKDII